MFFEKFMINTLFDNSLTNTDWKFGFFIVVFVESLDQPNTITKTSGINRLTALEFHFKLAYYTCTISVNG